MHTKDLTSLIEERYGSSEKLAKRLDLGIEMLFYLEADTFAQTDIQSVVSAMRGVISILREGE
ncbi:MAG: hypothetical protein COA50_11605 [Flavobacteriaceae bacterium]|nr:MAG: hypothetical protein COA50_11605 [Flavobacteriaceae bacterium]